MSEIIKAAEALSAPLVKLIGVCSAGIGKFYEPIDIVRRAKAYAKAHKELSEAIIENPTIYLLFLEISFWLCLGFRRNNISNANSCPV